MFLDLYFSIFVRVPYRLLPCTKRRHCFDKKLFLTLTLEMYKNRIYMSIAIVSSVDIDILCRLFNRHYLLTHVPL